MSGERGRERLLGERSFHQPTIYKIVFYDAWDDEKQFEILFFFFFSTLFLQLDKPCWKGVMPIAPTKFVGPNLWTPTIYSLTHRRDTHRMREGGRFWSSDQCMALKVIIGANNSCCWRDKVSKPNNWHERRKKSLKTIIFSDIM